MGDNENEPIKDLFEKIDAILDVSGPGYTEEVKKAMSDYLSKHDDWRSYVHFNDIKYARNLVKSSANCELMVICWLPHQVSPIHNHSGQQCWVAVLDGDICETYFKYQDTKAITGSGPLEKIGTPEVYPRGSVSYIDDDIALHVLEPVGGKRGITLHLYSKPITYCNIYCPETGTVSKRKTGFYTINRKIQPDQPAQCPLVTNETTQ